MPKKLPVELAMVQYASHTQIIEIAFRVYGGTDHFERRDAAHDALDDYTAFFKETENTVVSVDCYETKAETTPSGVAYVLFTFSNMPNTNT